LGFFFFNPLTDICGAILELGTIPFATSQKSHSVQIHPYPRLPKFLLPFFKKLTLSFPEPKKNFKGRFRDNRELLRPLGHRNFEINRRNHHFPRLYV